MVNIEKKILRKEKKIKKYRKFLKYINQKYKNKIKDLEVDITLLRYKLRETPKCIWFK